MITIVEPQEHIDKLWGKQRIHEGETYRLMRYVLRVDHEDKVLLNNTVTGHLVVLDQCEAGILNKLPAPYDPTMEQLVTYHFFVPESYDEHQQVLNLRVILRKLDDVQKPKGIITHYTILPTTACNANCFYCYEKGVRQVTMSEDTADSVVDFITRNCGEKKEVSIQWFGGEPTVAANRIVQICQGLQHEGIKFCSTMISNGYLFDEDMVSRAKALWHLGSLQITVDGTEETYNRTKAYKNAGDNPYKRVLANIGLLIEKKIRVGLRMNFNEDSIHEFKDLLADAKKYYSASDCLEVYAYPIGVSHLEGYEPDDESWQDAKMFELNEMARNEGAKRHGTNLPYLVYEGCSATQDSYVVIMPDGRLVKCAEQLGEEDTVGNVWDGICDSDLLQSWRCFDDQERCIKCEFYPTCNKVANCAGRDRCLKMDRNHEYIAEIIALTERWSHNDFQ